MGWWWWPIRFKIQPFLLDLTLWTWGFDYGLGLGFGLVNTDALKGCLYLFICRSNVNLNQNFASSGERNTHS